MDLQQNQEPKPADLRTSLGVSSEVIDPARLWKEFESCVAREQGGQNFFVGRVRAFNHGKKVVAVSYDAFEPLALQVFSEIVGEARAKWGEGLSAQVFHRVGKLQVGEASVWIGVSTPHRDEAYQASRYIIEQIKLRAPVWKKEHYENGETEWLKGHALCSHGGHA